MKPKVCPRCKEYLSQDELEYYCTECDYTELINQIPKWFWGDDE
jgi:ribosomal protein S27AE